MKVIFILPYFGKLPNYFNLFLKSCEYNSEFSWLIITNDREKFNYPSNVSVIYEEFDEFKQRFYKKFDFNINIDRPHKLCDYKPSYGYVLEELIEGYDFWGHCDPDCIFGDLSNFIKADILKNYDKIFTLGHMTLYRNLGRINSLFKDEINGILRYKQVFATNKGYAFDEQRNNSINDIFIKNNIKFYKENLSADIDPYNSNFRLSLYNLDNNTWSLENVKEQVFFWENGKIKRRFNNNLEEQEFIYIHLQKRKMENKIMDIQKCTKFLIVPNYFIEYDNEIEEKMYKKYSAPKIFNTQFIKTKYGSLKYRIKLLNLK